MGPGPRRGSGPATLAAAERRLPVIGVFQSVTRGINRAFTLVASLLALAIMLVILQDVARRYLFNDPTSWALDVSSFMLCYLFFLALGPALEAGAHVQVDLVERMLPAGIRRWVGLIALGMVLAFGAVFLWKLYVAAAETVESGELFPTATALPVMFVWLVGPVGAAQFVLTAISIGLERLRPNATRGAAR